MVVKIMAMAMSMQKNKKTENAYEYCDEYKMTMKMAMNMINIFKMPDGDETIGRTTCRPLAATGGSTQGYDSNNYGVNTIVNQSRSRPFRLV